MGFVALNGWFHSTSAAVWNRLQELDEEQAAADLPTTAPSAERITLEVELRSLERQVIKCVSDDEFLVRLMRPYLPGVPAGVPSHLAGYLPPGVAAEALRRAREQEDHPGAAPYFDAAEAVLAWRKGRPAEARDWANQALEHQRRYDELIVNSIADLVFVFTKALNISRVNPAVVHFTGRQPKDLVNSPLSRTVRLTLGTAAAAARTAFFG